MKVTIDKHNRVSIDPERSYEEDLEDLWDDLRLHDVVSCSEIEVGYIACDGLVYDLDDYSMLCLMSGHPIDLGYIKTVSNFGNKEFLNWYYGL